MSEELEELGITEEQVVETKAKEVEEPPKPESEEPPKPEAKKPEGYELVDFEKIPEEIRKVVEPRFHRLYGQMKRDTQLVAQMAKDNAALMDAVRKLQKTHSDEGFRADIETTKTQIQKAMEEGDYAKMADLTVYLTKRQAEAKAPVERKAEPKPDSFFNPREEAVLVEWSQETNPDGTPKRPWSRPGHPKHAEALSLMAGVFEDPQHEGTSMFEKLAIVDRALNPSKPASAPVLSGDGNMRTDKKKEPELTREQKAVARRMFSNLSADEAYKEYKDGMRSTGVYQ